jgi:hypothetical protein
MNTTPIASHFSLSNADITKELYSLFFPYDVLNDTVHGNDLVINTNATLKPFNEYIP